MSDAAERVGLAPDNTMAEQVMVVLEITGRPV
jgi:hypothetical protein